MQKNKKTIKIGIIILTTRDQVKDQVHGLTIGADDYIKSHLIQLN